MNLIFKNVEHAAMEKGAIKSIMKQITRLMTEGAVGMAVQCSPRQPGPTGVKGLQRLEYIATVMYSGGGFKEFKLTQANQVDPYQWMEIKE